LSEAQPRPRVVFTDETIRHEALDLLAPTCDVRVLHAYPSEDELAAACTDARGILARLGTVSARVIESAPQLSIIARHGVGVDAVDLETATGHGVVVTTTGSENAAAVAEYTFALLLALARKVLAADSGMRKGEWSRDSLVGTELDGRTLGIVGLGAIGRRVARLAKGFGMRVLAFDPAIDDAKDPGIELTSLEELLERSDVVTMHTRLTAQTTRLIDARALARMKRGAYLVNTARGKICDRDAVARALESGRLAGYAGDVWFPQPAPKDHPWRTMPHHGMTPHTSGTSLSAQARYAAGTREILECWFDERPIREEYLIVDAGKLADAGAHSYSEGDATGGSEEAARFKG
jgi:phosphoglycerate dehydrogenase-like enzyme